MKSRITCNRRVTFLALVMLVTATVHAAAWPQPAEARATFADGSVQFISERISSGIVPGQSFRICVIYGSRGGDPNKDGVADVVVANGRFTSPDGSIVFETGPTRVSLREWRCLPDVSYADLNVAGEPQTGRKQFGMQLGIQAPRGTKSSAFDGSAFEILDQGGATVFGAYMKISVNDY